MTDYPPPGQYPPPPPGDRPPSYPHNPSGSYPQQPGGEYPPPPGGPYLQEPMGRGLAITALVLGIIALLSCWTIIGGVLFGLFGLIFGIIAIVKSRRGTAAGGGMAITGTVLAAVGLIGAILIGVVIGNWLAGNGARDYVDCVNKAHNDQAKVNQCEQDWKQTLENKYPSTPTPTR